MARIARPWYWERRNCWYVTRDGQRHLLGEHPADAPPPKKTKKKWNAPPAILQAFHALLAAPPEQPPAAPSAAVACLTVAEVFDKFLDWCRNNQAARTFADHQERIQLFLKETKTGSLPATDLKPFHVIEWVDKHPTWGNTCRRAAIRSIQRSFNWADELGYLPSNPVRKIKKPPCGRREQATTPEQWAQIRDRYPEGDPFRDLLELCWESGCRPFEARTMELRHVLLDKRCVVFPPDEAKGKKRYRIIRLTPRAVEIVERRTQGRTKGFVLLNADGKPWTAFAMNCRFCRLQVAFGRERMQELGIAVTPEQVAALIPKLAATKTVKGKRVAKTAAELREEAKAKLNAKLARKHGAKFFAYAWRHGFATRKLVEGHDHLTVSELLGHADGTTLAKVYAHLDQEDEHLRKALG